MSPVERETIGRREPIRKAEPKAELVRDFWKQMTRAYGTRVIDKRSAWGMRLVGMFLARIDVLDESDFLRRYTTTIGKRIYTPFDVGVPHEHYGLWNQITVCVHEHQHVEQLLRDGWLKFAGRYLVSSAARAAYEAEAFRCNMELHFWRFGEVPDLKRLARRLEHYGCDWADIDMAARMLELSAATVRRGGIVNRASQKAISWLERHAPELKHEERE
jgi:hypothetical protein